MKAHSFGLDIGSSSIKAVWLGKRGEQIVLESVVSSPATSRGILSDSILDQQRFAQLIRSVLEKASIKNPFANVSVSEHQAYSKIIEMPELSQKELAISLQFQLEQHIPLPLDQVRTDFEILEHEEREGKKTMRVLIVAAPIAILERYEKILGLAGLKIETVETETIALYRCLFPLLSPGFADVVVQIGASTTTLALVRNKVLYSVFTIPQGGGAITRAVSIDLGIDATQAENFKKAYGVSGEVLEGKVGKALSPILEAISGDIGRGILSFKEKNPETQIRQLILSGGSALLPGIEVFFANALD